MNLICGHYKIASIRTKFVSRFRFPIANETEALTKSLCFQMNGTILSQRSGMDMNGPKQWMCLAGLAVFFLCNGCIGPQYTNHDIVVSGKPAPKLQGPRDPALQANLSTNSWPSQPFAGRAAEVGTTLFKSAGIQGWKDYHMSALATGVTVQHEYTSGPYLTIDLRLQSLMVKHVVVPLRGRRYMRVVIFLPKASADPAVYKQTNSVVLAKGKLVWNFDGWFEIHPREKGDVTLLQAVVDTHGGS
jgi:hypothetical protein